MDRRIDRLEPGKPKARRSANGDFDMHRTFAAIALSLTITAAAEPAFAIGPAGLARDLMYTSAIGHSPEVPLTTRAGFVRPGVPFVLRSPAEIQGEGYRLKTYSQSLTIVVDYVFSTAVEAVQAVAFLR
ncbi:hypothetical protein [Rhizobium leguminosarum]|uniref:hypothetical protein n=1 Tax=Rhizobium leguminosarum TaxID=384 RepID=UPI00102F386D|nr:hypothetical protein [Rhizobium leguminosarum]TAU84933.1 hypothetical protein ELI40_17485 [Rhizobium leguminosarum]TAX11080.1 hypothetical protein ELI07_17005 [Rhizobium leguminosarum]TAX31290.1 hypothetical protein ELI04_16560 [Rhizobium leguminosarum]TAY13957.1 hypothetical protein ELH96_20350 [Rhizobium leguminosarum]TAY18273.1 hypothetical protein ELH91_16495 [Rhizobium leguminosarum]